MKPFDADSSSPQPDVFPYASAAAFRTALRDRFAVIAKSETRYSLDELQRQFAYDRALATSARCCQDRAWTPVATRVWLRRADLGLCVF